MGFGGEYYGVEAAYAAVYVGEVAFVFKVFYGAGPPQQYAGAVLLCGVGGEGGVCYDLYSWFVAVYAAYCVEALFCVGCTGFVAVDAYGYYYAVVEYAQGAAHY